MLCYNTSSMINSYRLNKFLALTKLLTLLKYDEFKSYLVSQNVKNYDELFTGFKFYVKSICNNIMESISRGDFLFLEENMVIKRANFYGVPLSKLKNTCQKIIFLKNMKRLFESLYSSKDERDYRENFARTKGIFITMIDEYKNKIYLSKKFENENKEEIILNLAIFWNYIDYNDTGRGFPKGIFFSLEESNEDEPFFNRNRGNYLHLFEGYKYALVYVWDKLLSKEQKTVFPYEIMQTTNWEELDSFFDQIRTRIIVPIEKVYSLSGETFFRFIGNISTIIPTFFFEQVSEPKLTFIEELEQLFLWYPIQALSSEAVFSGASSCVITLEGSIGIKSRINIDEKVYVIRFIHPEHRGNSYSYAILIDTFGTIADYSGWLLFYEIGAEYGGFSYSSYRYVEDTLELYPDSFEIVDFKIETKELLRYIMSKSFNIEDVIEDKNIGQELEKILSKALSRYHKSQEENISLRAEYASSRGILLELIAYYYFNCKGGNVSLRYKNIDLIGQTDIDIISQKDNEILIISCMCSFDKEKIYKLNHIIESLKTKGWEMYDIERYKLKPSIFIIKSLTRDQKSLCDQNEISTYILEDLMDSEYCFTRITIPEIKRILLG